MHTRFLYDKKTKLCYIVFPGNASRTFESLFVKAGWESNRLLSKVPYGAIMFSHIQEPKERMTKGIAAILDEANMGGHIDDEILKKFVPMLYNDDKLHSVDHLFGILTPKIEFIVMDHKNVTCNELTNHYLHAHKSDVRVQDVNVKNVSTKPKLLLQQKIRTIIGAHKYPVYITDTAIYKEACERADKINHSFKDRVTNFLRKTFIG